ncbi:MAG: hypothetical protein KAT74_10130, partial [Candidatus Cloacimonetes bacterium]|nr:hypothetical protein [Candidatus Cloacimonadota bacterium]
LFNVVIYLGVYLTCKKIYDEDSVYLGVLLVMVISGAFVLFTDSEVDDSKVVGSINLKLKIPFFIQNLNYGFLELFFVFGLPLIIVGLLVYMTIPTQKGKSRTNLLLNRIMEKKSYLIESKKIKLNNKMKEKQKRLDQIEKNKIKQIEMKITDILLDHASKNNGIIMKSEIFDITDKYDKSDVLKALEKLKENRTVESQDNYYMFPSLV